MSRGVRGGGAPPIFFFTFLVEIDDFTARGWCFVLVLEVLQSFGGMCSGSLGALAGHTCSIRGSLFCGTFPTAPEIQAREATPLAKCIGQRIGHIWGHRLFMEASEARFFD